jgi:TldD protein
VAVRLLDAPQVKSGTYPVVTDYALTELFIHEAFGHLSEADNAYKNPELAETMSLGRRLGRDILTIYDTGEYEEHRGFLKYDDEGVRTQRTVLVEDGILVGRLHSRETAGLMGEEPTGSARALDYTYPPIVRMRSTCVEPGESTFEDMIADVEHGIYAVENSGGQTNDEMFNFNASHGYMIQNGETAELVRDVRLMGNVFTALKNIDMIGDTPQGWNSAGGCGKDGQGTTPYGWR